MPRFRSTQPPERQAASVVARLVEKGALRRNPARPPSLRTVANYRDCLLQIARRIAADGRELRDLDADAAVEYLRTRVDDLGQKALDMHRQALQAMLVHVSRRLPEGQRLTVVRSHRPGRKGGRAYTPQQVRMVAAAQNARNGLSTLIAHAAGLRAHEVPTLARPGEQPSDRRPARPEKFAGRPGLEHRGREGRLGAPRAPAGAPGRASRAAPPRRTGAGRRPRHPLRLALRHRRRRGVERQLRQRLEARARLVEGRPRGTPLVCPGAHAGTATAARARRCAGDRQPGARTFSPGNYRDLSKMMRFMVELTPAVGETLDWLVRVNGNDEPDDWTRCRVLVDLMLDRARQLREGGQPEAGAGKAQQPPRDDLESVRRERDALRNALEAERAVRRRDRERYAWIHASLRNARGAVARLGESRARYRDLALRVEAAVLRAPARDDPGGLEDRLRRALRDAAFELPDRRIPARSAADSRASPCGDSPPKRRKTS